MDCISATAALQLPVEDHGAALGRPTDILIDVVTWNVLGFVVHCADESNRFLPFAASQLSSSSIVVGSALILLDDVSFYERRSVSYRALLGRDVTRDGRSAGILRDVVLGSDGAVHFLELDRGALRRRIPAAGSTVNHTRASAA